MSEPLLLVVVEASVRASLLAALVAALLWLLRVPRGAPRHGAWLMVAVAMLLMPALQRLTPAIALPPQVPEVTAFVQRAQTPAPLPVIPPAPLSSASAAAPVSPAVPSSPMASSAAQSPFRWLELAGALYLVIVLALLLRLAVALRVVARIIRSTRAIDDGLWESPSVVTPVTVGFVRPRIVLPIGWKAWPHTTRHAIIAHERAHATRRDPLVALLTRLNACVFWFHPLAWWLERTLAAAAEQACDDVAVRAVPHPRQYVEALLAMADAARRAGGRIAWGVVGAAVTRRLSDRLDRILQGGNTSSTPRARIWLAVAGCAASVVVVAACRAEQVIPPLVQHDTRPDMAQRRHEAERREGVRKAARAMTWEEAEALEITWRRDRKDSEAAEKLLFFYGPDSGRRTPDDPRKRAARRALILWLIENEPDSALLWRISGRIFGASDWLMDPDAYRAAKRLWLAHTARPDVNAATLRNAAWFFSAEDKPLAERLLRQGQRLTGDPAWTARLGELYGAAILGQSRFGLSSTSASAAQTEYVTRIRATLDSSRDAALLTLVAEYLANMGMAWMGRTQADLENVALARVYLTRAIEIDPTLKRARFALENLDYSDQLAMERKILAGVLREEWPDVISKLPDSQRLPILIRSASAEYTGARNLEWGHRSRPRSTDEAPAERSDEELKKARASRERSVKYAQDALNLARRLPSHPDHEDVVFGATVALGANAFREGDRKTAVRYMLAAAEAPPASSGRVFSATLVSSLEPHLIDGLLRSGERETVILYFEQSAERRPEDRERLLAAAAAIRNGKLPSNYERGWAFDF